MFMKTWVLIKFVFDYFQLKEFLMQYSKLTELCFADCVTDFTGRTVKSEEVSSSCGYE